MSMERAAADDGGIRDDVVAVVRAVVDRGLALAGAGAHVLGSGVDEAVRILVTRRVERALRPGAPAVTADDLIDALEGGAASGISPWIGAGAARLARTGRVARKVGGRSPLGLAVRFGPGVYAVVAGNLRGLDAAAGRLATRAGAKGVDVDPDRARRVVVQALLGVPLDPEADPDHGALVWSWLGEAGRRAVPFGLDRLNGFRRGPTPEAVAAVLDAVPLNRLVHGR